MKLTRVFFSLLAVLLATSLLALAKPAPKVIAVINKAEWCAVCKANGMKLMKLMPAYADKAVEFVPNDLTNADTKAASEKELKKLGVAEAVAPLKMTGLIALVDAKTHKLLKTVSLAEPDAKLEEAINSTL